MREKNSRGSPRFSERLREGPTLTLTQITAVIKNLRDKISEMNLETLSIAKISFRGDKVSRDTGSLLLIYRFVPLIFNDKNGSNE